MTDTSRGESRNLATLSRPRVVNLASIVIADVGAATLVISFAMLDWFRNKSFAEIGTRLSHSAAARTWVANAYFSWLGWTLLALGLSAATAAAVPSSAQRAMRRTAVGIAIAGVILTFWAVKLTWPPVPSYWDFLSNQQAGFYVALVGFVIIAIAARGYRTGTASATVPP